VIEAVRKTKVRNGITGSFSILGSGDPSVGPITAARANVPLKIPCIRARTFGG